MNENEINSVYEIVCSDIPKRTWLSIHSCSLLKFSFKTSDDLRRLFKIKTKNFQRTIASLSHKIQKIGSTKKFYIVPIRKWLTINFYFKQKIHSKCVANERELDLFIFSEMNVFIDWTLVVLIFITTRWLHRSNVLYKLIGIFVITFGKWLLEWFLIGKIMNVLKTII